MQTLKNCVGPTIRIRSRDSLSPVCRIKKKSQFITVLLFSLVFFFTVFHPFSPFSITFNWLSKHFTVYHCFFSLFLKQISIVFFTIFKCFFSLTIFNRFSPFCIGTTICKQREIQCLLYAGFFWQDFSFVDISLLVTFQFWQHLIFFDWLPIPWLPGDLNIPSQGLQPNNQQTATQK